VVRWRTPDPTSWQGRMSTGERHLANRCIWHCMGDTHHRDYNEFVSIFIESG
jgi:hypothetical protein